MSPRDLEILRLLSNGLTAKLIGEELGLSSRTVERYIADMFVEFQAKNTTHLVAITIRKKIIS